MKQKSETLSMWDFQSLNIPETYRYKFNIYKALIPLTCDNCQRTIQPQEIFCRTADKLGTKMGIRYIFCSSCKPIE